MEESCSNSIDEEYFDFKNYPLNIDWQEIENEKSEAFSILERYGNLGVSVFCELSKNNNVKFWKKNFENQIISYFYKILKEYSSNKSMENYDKILLFIASLPNLFEIKKIIEEGMFTTKELLLFKIILDIYQYFLLKFDYPFYSKLLQEYIPTAFVFYNSLNNENIKLIYDKKDNLNIEDDKIIGLFFDNKKDYIRIIKKVKKVAEDQLMGLDISKLIL